MECFSAFAATARGLWAPRERPDKRKYVNQDSDSDDTSSTMTPLSTARAMSSIPSTPTLFVDHASSTKVGKQRVAIMKYQFGNYDYAGTNEMWNIPAFDGYEVDGFFYSSPGVVSNEEALKMQKYGWKSIVVDLEEGTPYVAGARVTTKKFKFTVPIELRDYDFVITHDCDVDADYSIVVPWMLELMEERGNAALFQQHER